MKNDNLLSRERRKKSIRKKIYGTSVRPRLSVFRSNLHVFAQVIDDDASKTLVSASTNSKEFKALIGSEKKTKTEIAAILGELLAKKAVEQNINQVVFDRNGYLFHGRVKAVAEGARKAGLNF